MRCPAAFTALALTLLASPAFAHEHESAEDVSRTEQFAQLPYWPGYWVSELQAGTLVGGQSPALLEARANGTLLTGFMSLNGRSANWNEEGRRRLTEVRSAARGRKADGWGFPMMMNAATPLAIIITPELVLITNSYNETRHIYTDGRPMPDALDMWPSTYGTSVGHWEGDVLVIETVMASTPSDYFHGAPPFSEDARYIERMRLEGERLVSDVTVEDPETLEEPFHTQVSWLADAGFDRMIHINWDNDRTGYDGDYNTIEAEVQED